MMDARTFVAGAFLAGTAVLCAGMEAQDNSRNAALVEEVYVVRPGDLLLWIWKEMLAGKEYVVIHDAPAAQKFMTRG